MSARDRQHITQALVRATGRRWCGNCRCDKPLQDGKWITQSRWICAGCVAIRKAKLKEVRA